MKQECFFSYEGIKYDPGQLVFSASLPGVRCNVCGFSWTGLRVLPIHCPTIIKKEIEAVRVTYSCCPIEKFSHYKRRWERILSASGINVELQAGDSLLPVTWTRPEKPTDPIAWPLGGPVVCKVVSDCLVKLDLSCTHLFPLPIQLDPDSVFLNSGEYSLVIVEANTWNSWYKQRGYTQCVACGRFSLPDDESKRANIECSVQRSRCVLSKDDIPDGADIFLSHIYRSGLVVSERVHNEIFPAIEGFVKVRKIVIV